MNPHRRLGCAWILAVSLLLQAGLARADPSRPADRATAHALMEEGDDKVEQKDFVAALKSFRAAHELMHVPTTGLAVAQALEALGQLVEACDAAAQVARMPATPGEPAPFTVARAEAGKLAEALAKRLGALIISVSVDGPRDGLRVELDGLPLPAVQLDLPRSVNPGRHTIRATAGGHQDDQDSVTVGIGETLGVNLVLRPITPPRPADPGDGAHKGHDGSGPDVLGIRPNTSGRRTAALWLGGAGLAGLATAGVLALVAKLKYDSVASKCNAAGCDDPGFAARTTARSEGNAATIAGGVAAACLVASLVLWLVAPSASPTVGAGAGAGAGAGVTVGIGIERAGPLVQVRFQ